MLGAGGGYVTTTNELVRVDEKILNIQEDVRTQKLMSEGRQDWIQNLNNKVIVIETNAERTLQVLEKISDALIQNANSNSALSSTIGRLEERLNFLERESRRGK